MIGDHLHVGVTELADEAGRILDVREEERHRAHGQLGRGAGYRHGISARITVPSPGGLLMRN